ncbi:hypothetical protein JY651_27855 [Pyxidicoccus parkwayensis]|uniref:Lipoprotein n=1 Tax=Pyxidicoccus parkwayensis TaxID=2813578 RepID=A0ABX7NK55_9BACT|nr:hypothetical protein [Pyxidicoccus parkwaysis]QSQ19160.1 hypothetical protein JY651_27855 [Pyxidicoccus parkwaysis]
MKRTNTWMMVCAFGLMVGCGGPLEEEAAPPEVPEGQEQEELFTQTIVRQLADGTMTQETTFITRKEQLAQLAEREALLKSLGKGVTQQDLDDLVTDGSCAGSSLWLFDQTNLAGRQLCLYKQAGASQGWLSLTSIIRYFDGVGSIYTWSGAVRSLWAGQHPGSLLCCTSTLCYSDFGQNFVAYEKIPVTVVTPPLGGTRRLNQAYLYNP